MATISCPSCGSTDELSGADREDGKLIRCGRCDHTWRRDLTARCRLCGSTDLEEVATSTLEEAGRGQQRTPSGIRTTHRCYGCGARDATSNDPVPAPADWRRQGSPVRPGPGDAPASAAPDERDARVRSAFGTFEVGATVGDGWQLAALLTRTSTGTLWRATGPVGEVVFKLVRGATVQRAAAAHAAAARAVTVVQHPYLLTVRGVLERGNDALIAVEPFAGEPLPGAPDTEVLRRVATAASAALAALHERGLAHLDIRPDKLLVDGRGGTRLVDLGSGRVRAQQAGAHVGRSTWRAPEQVVGGKHTAAADVYSLGLSLWHLAGGRLTDLGSTVSEQVAARVAADVPALHDDDAGGIGLPPAARELLRAATRRRPEQRPSGAELADGLAVAIDGA